MGEIYSSLMVAYLMFWLLKVSEQRSCADIFLSSELKREGTFILVVEIGAYFHEVVFGEGIEDIPLTVWIMGDVAGIRKDLLDELTHGIY